MTYTTARKVGDGSCLIGLIGLSASLLLISACGASQSVEVEIPVADWPAYGFDYDNSAHNQSETILSPENVPRLEEVWRTEGGGVTGTPVVVDGVVYFADWFGSVRAVQADDGVALWEVQMTSAPVSASVAVTEDVVVAGDLAGVLHALDRATGEVIWSTNLSPLGASLFASPVVVVNSVVIGMTDSELEKEHPSFRASVVAVDIDDGSELWRRHTDPDDDGSEAWISIWSSAAYDPVRGWLFVGTGDTNQPASGAGGAGDLGERAPFDLPLADGVLALDHLTGEIVWFFKLIEADQRRDFDVGASPNLFTIGNQDVVGVGGKSGDYVVLDRDTGELIWKTHLTEGSAIGGVMSTAAVGGGVIYVASNEGGPQGGTIIALNAGDGSILWQRKFDQAIIGGSMALANGVLYRGLWEMERSMGTVVALDAADGSILWMKSVNAPLAGGSSIANGVLYVGYGSGMPPRMEPTHGGIVAYRLP